MKNNDVTLLTFSSSSAASTKKFAQKFISQLEAPLVIALQGDLGAGKTTFVQAAIESLCPQQKVSICSPTFAIAKSYDCIIPIHHIDLYRVNDQASLVSLGIEELLFDENSICFVEWPERYCGKWPAKTMWIKITHTSDKKRSLEISIPHSLAEKASSLQKLDLK